MLETGLSSIRNLAEEAQGLTCASTDRAHVRHGLTTRLCSGVAGCIFMLALFAPVSIDFAAGEITVITALAGNGNGNFGEGKGNGGSNNQNPGKGDNGDDGDGGGDDGDGDDDVPSYPVIPVTEENGDHGVDHAADMADDDLGEAMDAIVGSPAEGPVAGTPATNLPTISQLFSMGEEATVSKEDELDLIANGWDAAN